MNGSCQPGGILVCLAFSGLMAAGLIYRDRYFRWLGSISKSYQRGTTSGDLSYWFSVYLAIVGIPLGLFGAVAFIVACRS